MEITMTDNLTETISVEVNSNSLEPSTLRNLVKEVSGRTISSEQASNLLDVFGEEIKLELNNAIRGFVVRHFGKKK